MKSWKLVFVLALIPLLGLFVGGCGDDPVDPAEDTTAPAAVGDLIAYDATLNTITLSWTAPGDDEDTGTASTYDIRYTTNSARLDWASATPVTGEPSPAAPGSNEVFVVTGLDETTEYTFALKTADEVPNWSDMSNTAVDTTMGSLIVAFGSSPNYSLVNPVTGDEIAYVNTGLTAVELYCLGFQGRKVFTIAKAASARSAVWGCDAITGAGQEQITDDNVLDVRQFDGNPVAPILALAASDTFTSWENIYTMSETGGAVTQLTDDGQTFSLGRMTVEILGAYEPNWSPDGTQIAFHAKVREVGTDYPYRHHVICVMDADGGNLTPLHSRQLETAVYRTPVWTADGNYVVFIEDNNHFDRGVVFHSMSTGNEYNLWSTFDINDTPPRSLAMDPWHMRIAVYYAFPGWDDIWVADLETAGEAISASTPVELTDKGAANHQFNESDWAPWSPIF